MLLENLLTEKNTVCIVVGSVEVGCRGKGVRRVWKVLAWAPVATCIDFYGVVLDVLFLRHPDKVARVVYDQAPTKIHIVQAHQRKETLSQDQHALK